MAGRNEWMNDTVTWMPVKLMNESLCKTTSIENNLPERKVTTKQQKDNKNNAACTCGCGCGLWLFVVRMYVCWYVIERHTIDAHKSSVRHTYLRSYTRHAKTERLLSTKHHWQHQITRSLIVCPLYYTNVYAFSIWNCRKTESNGWGNGANFTCVQNNKQIRNVCIKLVGKLHSMELKTRRVHICLFVKLANIVIAHPLCNTKRSWILLIVSTHFFCSRFSLYWLWFDMTIPLYQFNRYVSKEKQTNNSKCSHRHKMY